MDLLEDIVAGLEVRSQLYFRAEFSAPFAVAVPEDRKRIRFHVAGPGRSWIGLASGESAWYEHGDLVLVPHGAAHVLADAPTESAQPLDDVLGQAALDRGLLRHGGDAGSERRCVIVCGHFAFDETALHPLLASLPPLIQLRGSGPGPGYGWMPDLLLALEREAASDAPAGDAVVRRLSEILFIQVLRAIRDDDAIRSGVSRALDDPQLGRALRSIHAQPQQAWSLEALAAVAGASRSVFAERFRSRVGVTPMRYLTTWRMQKARRLLADRALSVGEVGRRVGYGSEAAFNRAFRDVVGEPPGRYRRARLRAG